jgi:hypothetical protein
MRAAVPWEPGPDEAAEAEPESKQPRLETYTTFELRSMELPPVVWFVDDVITHGLWILAGPPKVGKSYLVLDLLLALATGGLAFGSIPVDATTVLYLALEDNARRIRSRLSHLRLDDTGWPSNFHLTNHSPKLDTGLLPALEAWLDQHPDCRVVVIDTLARVRGKRNRDEDLYSGDSRVTEQLQALAMRRDIAVIIVHHVRKAPGSDVFETISGSYGITGPADGILVLQRVRGEADATLHITGRDVEERELALSFDSPTGTWKLLGDARHYAQSTERRTILETVTANPGLTPKQIADAAGLKHASVKHLCIRLRDEAKLNSDDTGRYYPVHSVHPTVGSASETTQPPVNGSEAPHSPVHPTTVNGVNGSARETFERLYTLHKRGQIKDTNLVTELDQLFALRPVTTEATARLLTIADQVLT